tara:strand:- start:40 stop:378 length:339 start_codon:yes stop_codon:yes gene_type:complete
MAYIQKRVRKNSRASYRALKLEKMMNESNSPKTKSYWRENIRIVLSLLTVWFFVSFVMAILFVDILDNIRFFGFKFGFWMAQQGSIYCFVIIIFIYVYRMNKLDRKYGVSED